MLLLGHAAVSARRGPRGTCQETRAAPWAPAECGVTARSASDGVDVNGIRVHHRRLQYRRYQCGMSAKVSPQILLRLRPRIVWADEGRGRSGIPSPSLFRGFAAKPRVTLGMDGGRGCCGFLSLCFFAPLARNAQHYGKGRWRCCVRLRPSDYYFGSRGGTLLVLPGCFTLSRRSLCAGGSRGRGR